MLTSITVDCDNPFSMAVIGAAPRDPLRLQSITGLGPADKSLFVGDYARDGGIYVGRRANVRNPVLSIEINPDYSKDETVQGWRDILYRSFNNPFVDTDNVNIILHDDVKADRVITGYSEKWEGEVFSSDTAVQISLVCPDPYIRDAVETQVVPPEGTSGWQKVPFVYAGTAEAGFETTIEVTATTMTLTLDNNGKKMVLSYPSFKAGDIVYINTIPGQRQITLNGQDIYYTLSSTSDWLTLHSQMNSLQVYGVDAANVVAAITNLTYTQLWDGV